MVCKKNYLYLENKYILEHPKIHYELYEVWRIYFFSTSLIVKIKINVCYNLVNKYQYEWISKPNTKYFTVFWAGKKKMWSV